VSKPEKCPKVAGFFPQCLIWWIFPKEFTFCFEALRGNYQKLGFLLTKLKKAEW